MKTAEELSALMQRPLSTVVSPLAQAQREQARAAVAALYGDALDAEALDALHAALGAAQNGPPDGEADGSIGPGLWDALTQLATAFQAVQNADAKVRIAAGRVGEKL